MIKLIVGNFGKKLLPIGTILNLTEEKEQELVNRKVAKYTEEDGTFTPDATPPVFLSEEQIKKMKKEDLISYGAEIGIESLNNQMSKENLVDAIINFIEEEEAE